MTESVVILGSTGTIGSNTLDVIRRHPDKYQVVGLSAQRDLATMQKQCAEFNPEHVAMADCTVATQLAGELSQSGLKTRVSGGDDAVSELAASGADIVVCAIVGAVGLSSTVAAVCSSKKVLIANKESLVMGGSLVMDKAKAHGTMVIPIDSEHNAIFQCLPSPGDGNDACIRKIWLTGSGGPFRKLPAEEFCHVTPQQACTHPNWQMGPKVSVDSATMMNKGLELIEACVLFSLEVDDIEIIIHPQSVVHSMVEYDDGSILAQLGNPDMRIPIAHALAWPRRIESGAHRLNLLECRFDFETPDYQRFPSLNLARDAARTAGVMPTAMNAANEVAVEAFLGGRLRFDRITQVVEHVMQNTVSGDACDLESVVHADQQARRLCNTLIK